MVFLAKKDNPSSKEPIIRGTSEGTPRLIQDTQPTFYKYGCYKNKNLDVAEVDNKTAMADSSSIEGPHQIKWKDQVFKGGTTFVVLSDKESDEILIEK